MIKVLKTKSSLALARQQLRNRGLDFTNPEKLGLWRRLFRIRFRSSPPIPDEIKSWDVVEMLEIIERHASDRKTPILDLGCFNSEILYALHALGYRKLAGCDLNPQCRWMGFWHRIKYVVSDLTRTPFPDKSFGALTSVSVIEHGVDLSRMAEEAARLLRPGGVLLLTTDFDSSGNSHDIPNDFRVFNQSWQIFNPESMSKMVEVFRDAGFRLLAPDSLDMTHDERPINWNRHDYTFALVAFVREGN